MANDETLAALERAAEHFENAFDTPENTDQYRADAALIRAHIETLRNGGERAQIVALEEEVALLRHALASKTETAATPF